MNVLWMWRTDLVFRNKTHYQRPLAVAQSPHQLTMVVRGKSTIAPEIADKLAGIDRSPALRNGTLEKAVFLLYGFWAFFKRRHETHLLYTPPDFTILWAALIKLVWPSKRWVADLWDDPRYYQRLQCQSRLTQLSARLFSWLVERAVRQADLVVTIGRTLQDELPRVLIREFGVSSESLLTVTNGVDLDMFNPDRVVPAPRNPDCFRLLYVGFLMPELGVGDLLAAVQQARGTIPGIELVLAGWATPHEREWLKKTIAHLDIAGQLDYRGVVAGDKMPALIQSSDICIYSFRAGKSLDGVFPIKVYEYLAMSKPVIATALPGVLSIIAHGENGWLVPPGDSAAMADAIAYLYKSPSLRQKLSTNARPSVLSYSWERINRQVVEHFGALAAG